MASLGCLALLGKMWESQHIGQRSLPLVYSPTTQCWWASHSISVITIGEKRAYLGHLPSLGKAKNHEVQVVLCCWAENWETPVLNCFLLLGGGLGNTRTADTTCAGRGSTCSWQVCSRGLYGLPRLCCWQISLLLLTFGGIWEHGLNYPGSIVATIAATGDGSSCQDLAGLYLCWNFRWRECSVFLDSGFFYLISIIGPS